MNSPVSVIKKQSDLIKAIDEENENALDSIEKNYNSLLRIYSTIEPTLTRFLSKLRISRASTSSELANLLKTMKDIRTFFLEDNFEKEMARIERFVGLCKDIKELTDNGMLESVSDIILKLAEKDGGNG